MIFKKPYAFLVKYFKLIHLALFLLLIFISIKYISLLNFFNTYVSNGYKTSVVVGLSATYTSFFFFLALFLTIAISGAILYLLVYKKKPIKFYIILLVYYLILFFFLFYLKSLFDSIQYSLISATLSRSLRDIILVYFLPQVVFICFAFIRMIGFDIKKFDFKSDIKDLGISSKDAEEVELNLDFQGFKAKRKVNKTARELKYYILENKFIVICITAVLLVIGIYNIVNNLHSNMDKTYNQNQVFVYENIRYKVTNTYVSNLDYKGNVIKDGSYFVVVNYNAENSTGDVLKINYDDFKLNIDDNMINPSMGNVQNFIDLGYKDSAYSLMPSSSKNISMIYEIPEKLYKKSMTIEINNGTVLDKKEYINKHIYVNTKPIIVSEVNIQNYNLNDMVSFADSYLGNSSIIIKNISFMKTYKYEYEVCKSTCKKYNDMVVPSYKNNRHDNMLMVMDVSLILDDNTAYIYNYKEKNSFIDNFMFLKTDDLKQIYNVTPQNVDNVIVFEVPKDVEDSENVFVVIKIRNKEYNIKVK